MDAKSKIKDYFNILNDSITKVCPHYDDIELPFPTKNNTGDEWVNRFYRTPIFRHAHLEYYTTNKITVLHSNTFPNVLSDDPIMGFDLIALGNKITGLFFDFSPISKKDNYMLRHLLMDLKNKFKSPTRPLPEWANFFSSDFYCVSPLEEEVDNIVKTITDHILYYLEYMDINSYSYKNNINKQNEYCVGQKKNDKTFNALAAEIGKDNAQLFLDKYLFPEIDLYKP